VGFGQNVQSLQFGQVKRVVLVAGVLEAVVLPTQGAATEYRITSRTGMVMEIMRLTKRIGSMT